MNEFLKRNGQKVQEQRRGSLKVKFEKTAIKTIEISFVSFS
jgi:hypothetical protein